MAVPFLDLKRQYARIRSEVEPVVAEVFATQYFILGPNGKALESEAAAYLGASHAIGVASGTDALLLALRAFDVEPGEGVLTTSFTFFATAGAIHNAKGRPFFADIDRATFNLSPDSVREFLTKKCTREKDGTVRHKETKTAIRGVLPVHLYGLPCDMDELMAIAKEYGLFVLEDACQSFGAVYKGRRSGAIGDAGAYSFFPTKNLGGAGDGGMITTSSSERAARLQKLRVHGGRERYYHDEIGYNSRLDEVQAAVLRIKLRHLDEWNKERANVARLYNEGLAGIPEVVTPSVPSGLTHIYHQYVIRAKDRDGLKAHLEANSIGAMIYYPVPLHAQKCFSFLGYKTGDLPETEKAAAEVLALPVFAELSGPEVAEVCGAIRAFYGDHR